MSVVTQPTVASTGTTVKKTFCSICSAFCGFEAVVDDGRVVEMRPDPDNPMSRGFSCTKADSSTTCSPRPTA